VPLLFQTLLRRGSLHSEYQNESTHMRKVHVCFNNFSILHLKNSKDLRFCQFQDFVNFDIKFGRFVWTQNSTVRRQRFSADFFGTAETGPRGPFQTHAKECGMAATPDRVPTPRHITMPCSPCLSVLPVARTGLFLHCRAPRSKDGFFK